MRKQRAFATLSNAEIDQIADWVRHETYATVLERINKPRPEGFGLSISIKPLQLLHDQAAKLDKINNRIQTGEKLTLATLNSILAGDTPASDDAHAAILHATHEFAASGDNTPAQLLALQRLADFPARAEIRAQRLELDHARFRHKIETDAHRKHLADERLELARQSLAFRQKQHQDRLAANAAFPSSQAGSLGPAPANIDQVGERLRRKWGMTEEQWAARLALPDAHFDQDGNLVLAAPEQNPANEPATPHPPQDQQEHPAPTPIPSPSVLLVPPLCDSSLPSTVEAYNIKRAEEYWEWRRMAASLPDGQSVPDLTTQYRHCPCGRACPCPEHENEPFGEYPTFFWHIHPHHPHYAACLTARGLPCRVPFECVPEQFRIYDSPQNPR